MRTALGRPHPLWQKPFAILIDNWPVLGLLFCLVKPVPAQAISSGPEALVNNGGYVVADRSAIVDYRGRELFIPASTIKLVTVFAALEILGPRYRFATDFYLDSKGWLWVVGHGDPFLTSEELLAIAQKLHSLGVKELQGIYLDSSYFELQEEIRDDALTANPYDASNGALAANFNSIAVGLSSGKIISAEAQTPDLPLLTDIDAALIANHPRLNISKALPQQALPAELRYFGELLAAQLEAAGTAVHLEIKTAKYSEGSFTAPELLYRHLSTKTLTEMAKECLLYSNNFIANQLFLAVAAKIHGSPANWSKARLAIRDFLQEHGVLTEDEIHVYEGSGLSRRNRITAAALIKILNHLKPYQNLLPERNGIALKSGTLTGVYCYAGYFGIAGDAIPFALLLNQKTNNRDALLARLLDLVRKERASK